MPLPVSGRWLALALAAVVVAGCGGTPARAWKLRYGSVEHAPGGAIVVRPTGHARAPEQTSAGLLSSIKRFREIELSVELRTLRQFRQPRPNQWEVAWLLWDFSDDRHFYSVVLKRNGWEIGKEDPAYPGDQRFLATGSHPRFAVGRWHRVEVRQTGNQLTVSADGQRLATVVDDERPYLDGAIGYYTEDADAAFRRLRVGSQ